MQNFQLIYKVPHPKDTYLVPALLPAKPLPYNLESADKVLRFIVAYPRFLPTSIIPRLMIQLHKNVYQKRVWKTGMVLYEDLILKVKANIFLDEVNRQLHIQITGEKCSDFLIVIRNTLDEIHRSFRQLLVEELIPLPINDFHTVKYEELLGHKKMKWETYRNGMLRKEFSVKALLNGIDNLKFRQRKFNYSSCCLFLSYAHEDVKFKDALSKHLISLKKLYTVKVWDDSSIGAGEIYDAKQSQHLQKADIVLCLISSAYFNDDKRYEKELQASLKAKHNPDQDKWVVPIYIRPCLIIDSPIAGIKGLPTQPNYKNPNKWIGSLKKRKRDKAWLEVITEIKKLIEKIMGYNA